MRRLVGGDKWLQRCHSPEGLVLSAVARRTPVGGFDIFNKYIKNRNFAKTDGVDPFIRVKMDQQDWNHVEQFDGYSESVLRRPNTMSNNAPNYTTAAGYEVPEREDAFVATYDHYGSAADLLEKLEADVLHPRFHELIEKARKHGEDLAAAIDEKYGKVHPTYKLFWDLIPCQQYNQLQDWIERLLLRRKEILDKLSPEFVDKMEQLKSTAEMFKERLRKLERAVASDQLLYLDKSQFTDDELAVINQKVSYFRRMRKHGEVWDYGEYQHH